MAVPEHHCPFQRIFADDEGRIFVMTYERMHDGAGNYYDVFDDEGYQHVKRFKITWNM